MKQKYKVFINDQEIEFKEAGSASGDSITLTPNHYDPVAWVNLLSNKSADEAESHIIYTTDPDQAHHNFVSNFKIIKAAGGLVRRKSEKGEMLMIYRLGKWDLPKGKTEKGENERESALREVEEECGITQLQITSRLPKTWHLYFHKERWVVKETSWFMMTTEDTSLPLPQTEEGITEVRWVEESELPVLLSNSYASIRDLIRQTILNR